MILSDNDIRSKIEAGIDLVTPFCEENLQAASYDLTMSNTISVGINTGNVINLSDDDVYCQQEIPPQFCRKI